MSIVIGRNARGEGTALTVVGRLDAETAGDLRDAVAAEIRRGIPEIGLDLTGITFLSSAGLGALMETQREARKAGGDCHIESTSDPVRRVLELTRLDRVLMRSTFVAADAATDSASAGSRDVEVGGVRLVGLLPPPARPLPARVHGSRSVFSHPTASGARLRLHRDAFALGIGAIAEENAAGIAGELVAAAGTVYHRAPRPFAVVDFLTGSGELVAEADLLTGLSWDGFPGGRAGFEPVEEGVAVGIDELADVILRSCGTDTVAIVVAGEVHGLVAAELIRPLTEAGPDDHPLLGTREIASRWLSFSREPVHAGRTAVAVGVVSRATGPSGPLGENLSQLGPSGVAGHLHAVVYPHRPIRRSGCELAAVLSDLAASEPLAVVHLLADERPVLGRGASGFVRGACWFAPVDFREGAA